MITTTYTVGTAGYPSAYRAIRMSGTSSGWLKQAFIGVRPVHLGAHTGLQLRDQSARLREVDVPNTRTFLSAQERSP